MSSYSYTYEVFPGLDVSKLLYLPLLTPMEWVVHHSIELNKFVNLVTKAYNWVIFYEVKFFLDTNHKKVVPSVQVVSTVGSMSMLANIFPCMDSTMKIMAMYLILPIICLFGLWLLDYEGLDKF